MRRAHSLTGWLAVAAFICTGIYLHFRMDALAGGIDAARSSLRANHVYILFSGLVNIALAAGVLPPAPHARRRGAARALGHALTLAGPPTLLAAFLIEGPHPSPDSIIPGRLVTVAGVMGMVLGIVCIRLSVQRVRPVTPSRS